VGRDPGAVTRTPFRRLAAGLALLAAATGVLVVARTGTASAAPALAQTGAVVTTGSTSITLTLPSGSTAGNLLIASFDGFGSSNNSNGPAGWQLADEGSGSASRRSAIWYYPNNPGGISSANFSIGAGTTYIAGQMTEWSGMGTLAPLDVYGRKAQASSTTINVNGVDSNNNQTSYANEIAVATFQENLSSASAVTFTPGAGWTNLGNTGATSQTTQYTSDYITGIALNNSTNETETSNVSSSATGWEGIIATFAPAPTCTGGSLTLQTVSVTWSSLTLSGLDQTKTTNRTMTPDDERGTNVGWNIQLTSTQFTAGGHTLSTTATTVTAASATATPGTCTLPTNSITYPITVPSGAGPPAAVKVYNAAANTGEGQSSVQFSFKVAVPASAFAGSYTSTWTFSIVSGP